MCLICENKKVKKNQSKEDGKSEADKDFEKIIKRLLETPPKKKAKTKTKK